MSKPLIALIAVIFLTLVTTPQSLASSNKHETIWQPTPQTSWQWQLTGKIKTSYNVSMYDIDLEETPQKTIDQLQQKGIKVVCYFSGGSYEPYRQDANLFPKKSLGKKMQGWNEKWLDISNYQDFAAIMEGRLDLAVQKNCDGVEVDNMDAYENRSGFNLSYNDQLTYNIWMAEEAHKRNLSIGLKNDLDQVQDLVDYYDFAINEQCFQYEECDKLLPFINSNKAVFGVEYKLSPRKFCAQANALKFSWLKANHNLNGRNKACK